MALTTVPVSLSATALTLTTAAQPNITSVGTLTGLTVSGNIAGTLTTAAQTNITSVGTLTSLTVSGALNGTLSTAAQTNITSLGTLSSLTISGDLTVDTSTLKVDSSTNRVGVGIPSPAETLHAYLAGGNARVEVESTTGVAAFKATNNSGSYAWYVDNTADKFHLFDFTDSTQPVTIDGDGKVGIGTTSPATDIAKFGGSAVGLSVAGGQPVVAVRATGNAQHVGYLGQAGDDTYLGALGGGDLYIQTGTGGTTKMTVQAGGNVGIGTTSPDEIFHVKTASGVHRSRFESGNNHSLVRLIAGTGSNAGVEFYSGAGNVGNITADSSSNLLFEPAGTERWRINNVGVLTSGGNTAVSIGGTPADANYTEVGPGYINLSRDDTADAKQILFGKNGAVHSYFETKTSGLILGGTNSQLYLPTGRVQARTAMMGEVGSHAMFGSNSASEPIAISRDFSISYPDIVISTYGNIGIGTTSPAHYGNYKTLNIEHGGVGSIIQLNGATTNMRHLIQNNNGQMILSADHGAVAASSSIYLQTDGTNRMTVSDTSYPGFVKVNGSAGALVVAAAGITTFYSTGTNQGVGLYQGGAYSSCGAHMEIATDGSTGWSPIYINKYNTNSSTDNRWMSFGVNAYNNDSATIAYSYTTGNFTLENASDYRIKENVENYSGGLEKINAIRVVSYNKINNTVGTKIEGFIAHELQEIIPAAVSGEKDAMKVDEAGETVPNYQMLSKETLVPYLVSAIQELSAEVKALKAKLEE